MKYLPACGMNEEQLELLLSLTSIKSEPIKYAITRHLVNGWPTAQCATVAECDPKNLDRALKRLNEVAGTVERLIEIRCKHITEKTNSKPVIKLTNELPTEEGKYFNKKDESSEVEILVVETCDHIYPACGILNAWEPVNERGGYWAKVDQSAFEVRDEN